jgi:uncharacterized protein (UPF0371 family)
VPASKSVNSQKPGFDNELYLEQQTREILERAGKFQNKLYLEFGGKLMFDYHAARVLPGYDPNVKIRLLQKLKDRAEILLCIHAGAIEKKKVRADFGITYDNDVLKIIDDLKDWDLSVAAVVITRFQDQPAVTAFQKRLERRGVKVVLHRATKGYPTDVDRIVSDDGYGANPFIETTKPLVVVTGPGPGSGKLGTCLSQLYHEHKRGVKAGYAKFETFPIWSIALKHPVNVAYEAATAEMKDFNLIDSFHLQAHGVASVNYNRDMEIFPVVKRILTRILGPDCTYESPTDMGVNRAGFGIVDDPIVQKAAVQECIRRFFRYRCEYMMGLVDEEAVQRVELILKDLGVAPEDRAVVVPARKAAEEGQAKGKGNKGVFVGAAIQFPDGSIVTGKNSEEMHAASALVLNALKHLAGIPDKLHLLPPDIIKSIGRMKKDYLKKRNVSFNLDEFFIALGISASTNPVAQAALEKLPELRGCEVHMTHLPTPGDEEGFRRLGVNLTSDAQFASKDLFIN